MLKTLSPLLLSLFLTIMPEHLLAGTSERVQQDQTQVGSTTSTLANRDVLDMLKIGLSPDIVVAKIKASTCNFDTSFAALKQLKDAGTPDVVILAMIEASSRNPNAPDSESAKRIPAKSPSDKDAGQSITTIVYVARDGTKYHRATCQTLANKGIPLDLRQAIRSYEPCIVCRPPKLTEKEKISAHEQVQKEEENLTAGHFQSKVSSDRAKRDAECPGCVGVTLYYLDPRSGRNEKGWMSNNQSKWLQEEKKNREKKKLALTIWFTDYQQNADYLVFWTQAQGYRPYVYYTPRTTTEEATVDGTFRARSTGDYNTTTSGSFNGTVRVERTEYQQQAGEWPYIDVVMTVYDARTGQKVYETWHQANFRWSKSDKDCLVDTMKFLRQKHP